jgi:hypothetical protein
MNCHCGLRRVSSLRRFAEGCSVVTTLALLSAANALAADRSAVPATRDVGTAVRQEVERDWIDRSRRFLPAAAAQHSPRAEDDDFSFADTRRVIQRANQLADRLRASSNTTQLDALCRELERLSSQLNDPEASDNSAPNARRRIYLQVRWLARRIAFTNPLLNFDKLLFVKRHDAAGVFHMCDQYYGCNAVPGGGLFVLSDPLGPHPKLTKLLQGITV